MTNQNNDLPINPPGISFEDWAALLTGGTGGAAPMSPPPSSAPVPPPAAAGPAAVVPPAASPAAASVPPVQPSQVSPAASDPLAEALEASWRESLRQEALRDASQVQNPEPVVAPVAPAAPLAAPVALPPAAAFAAPAPMPPPVEAAASGAPLAPPAPVGESRRSRRAEIAAEASNPFTDGLEGETDAAPLVAPVVSAGEPALPTVPDFSKTAPLDSGLFNAEVREPDAVTAVLPVVPTEVIDIAPPAAPVAPIAADEHLAAPESASEVSVEEAAAGLAQTPPTPAPAREAARERPEPTASAVTEKSAAREAADRDLVHSLREVVLQGASDLHVTANSAPTIRIHGGLTQLPGPVWTSDKAKQAIYSIMSPAQRQKFERELELDFAYAISENARFRVNIYQQRENVGAAFRLIPTELKTLEELGVPSSVGRFATLPRGLVLITGPTGSGKSTTLAALIDLVNSTRADHIVTVEDPIEFMHNHKKSLVNQREVGHDTHSFAAALKHVLRQDPDVILVGELRDLETISVALTAAETGHLVFATLHTQSAAQTIDRIIDVYPPHQQNQVRAQLAATLKGVGTQTLVKRASGQGRVVATEILITTPAIANLVREGQTFQVPSAMQAGRGHGMHTLDQHLAELANEGKITRDAAFEKSNDRESLKQLISRTETQGGGPSLDGIDFGDAYSSKDPA
ncbi:type IV pilus twitching motility protein PilT [Leifsonia sp. Root60]|uniref:type IV pilus twitching motility protein PilT n=1 Tax=Leifsonia sp. Root60 TaxID=1736567 RepID=UPI000AA1576E